MSDQPSYYEVSTVADIFDKSKKTIRRWCRNGTIKAKKDQVNGQLYIPKDAVEDRLEDLRDRGPPGEMPDELRPEPDEDDPPPEEELNDSTTPETGDDEGSQAGSDEDGDDFFEGW
jgi:DNA-binding transcriptional MerR regulator